MKKMFKSKNNLILTIVALVECILLLAITTYSWIESASSLRIATSNPVTIADSLNYEYVIDTSKARAVDLSTYFSDTAFFSFAHASSADGKTMFLQRTVTNADGTKNYVYRQGDTTDYNTAYYNFDFLIDNSDSSESVLYFFDSENIFYFDESSIVLEDGQTITDEDKQAFLNAFRIAITSDTTTNIYSKSGETCSASNTTTTTAPQAVKAFSNHLYKIDDTEDEKQSKKLFYCTGSDTKNINIKIWFECNDEDFFALDSDVKSALLGATVKINLVFNNAESSYKTFRFNDYTNSIPADDTSGKTVYFYDGVNAHPMAKIQPDVESDGETGTETDVAPVDYTTWATCDENGEVLATVPDSTIKNLYGNTNCYYFYGTLNSSGNPVVTYKWIPPVITSDYTNFTFNALSVTPTSASATVGVGYWDDTVIKAVSFADKTTYNSDNAYNAGGYQFVSENHLYIGKSGDSATPIKMNLIDADNKIYKAYIPADFLNNQTCFYYTRNSYYTTATAQITWTAGANQEESPVYTAVGYSTKGKLSTSTFKSEGVGTWGETQRINLSAELIDATALAKADYRFCINTNVSPLIYMATDASDPLTAYVYVPVSDNINQFYYYDEKNALYSNWGGVGSSNSRNSDSHYVYDTYYPTTAVKGVSTGQWNPVVLVDGTADNLIGYTLNIDNQTGGSLKYRVDGGAYQDITKIDDYRYVTADLGSLSNKVVDFKWTAYTENATLGFVDTVFDYTFNLGENTTGVQYFVVTEAGSNYTQTN